MRPTTLAQFIRDSTPRILDLSIEFARTIPSLASTHIKVSVLRDHLPLILAAVANDLEQSQTRSEALAKAEGRAPEVASETAAQAHGRMRAEGGLTVDQVVSEYRLLRSSVSRLWLDTQPALDAAAADDLIRFDEAIDQAVAESVAFHSKEVDRWRHMLLAILGHDLRDPLNTIMMTAQVLEREARTEPSQSHIRLLSRGAQRLRVLLDSLLEYSNASLGSLMILHRSDIDLDHVCRAEIELLRAAFQNAEMRVSTKGSLAGSFDENRVRQALTNLVANAVQYRVPDSAIDVSVERESESMAITVRNRVAEPIDQAALDTLFEPLRRRDGTRQTGRRNLGLGLFIVREIARAHGGDVTAAYGDGCVDFTLRLAGGRGLQARAT